MMQKIILFLGILYFSGVVCLKETTPTEEQTTTQEITTPTQEETTATQGETTATQEETTPTQEQTSPTEEETTPTQEQTTPTQKETTPTQTTQTIPTTDIEDKCTFQKVKDLKYILSRMHSQVLTYFARTIWAHAESAGASCL